MMRGAYRWVRHPLYFFSLVMIWSFPDLTADRILFNVSWTAWIVVGTYLEERDLAREFGDAYRDYQRRVPMWVPRGAPVSKEDVSPSNPDTD
jgi:protein-S-isoprenylcysteine O-methyltransferase Ste14